MTAEGVHEETVGALPSPDERETGKRGIERIREVLDKATPAPTSKTAEPEQEDPDG